MGLFDFFSSGKTASIAKEPVATDNTARASLLIREGNALEDSGHLQEAMERYRFAAALDPGLAQAHLNMGNVLLAQGDAAGSIHAYSQALAIRPAYAAAHFNVGNAHARQGDFDAAARSYRRAIELDGNFVEAWIALGNIHDDSKQYAQAVQSYECALQIRPDYAQVLVNLGNVQRQLGELDQAEESCCRAIQLQPDLGLAQLGLAAVLRQKQDWQGALAAFRQAASRVEDPGAALVQAYHCANHLCDWSRRKQDEQVLADLVAKGARGVAPFFLLSLQLPRGGEELLQKQAAARFVETSLGHAFPMPSRADRAPRERLRIGYLSADFHDHATMHLLRGTLICHDRSRFEVHAYSFGPVDDAVTQFVRRASSVFRDVRDLSDEEAAQLIEADGIDILVDLKGLTQHARLGILARRPAPVVVNWLGYPGTMGVPSLADYVIGDAFVTPPESAPYFSETLALMPHCYQPNDNQKAIAAKPSRAQAGLPEEAFIFCSFNQSYKIGPDTFDVWCALLQKVPGSILWLLPSSPETVANLRNESAARGIDPQRLVFAPMLPLADHLARLSLADVALDTFPYNSHTTGSDALWAGVPLVARHGSTFASRVAASLLHAAELPELVAQDWDEYLSIALSLAMDADRLAAVRSKLATGRGRCALFDTARFSRDLERLYGLMWEQHRQGIRSIIALEDAPRPSATVPVPNDDGRLEMPRDNE